MESKVTLKYLRSTPRKARLVADEVRGKLVSSALNMLEFSIQKAVAKDFAKLIKSAVANIQNGKNDANIEIDSLVVKQVLVDHGPTLKRIRPRAQGRVGRILKRMCHITVTVSN
jgi:large subunit ribosomal protein L22